MLSLTTFDKQKNDFLLQKSSAASGKKKNIFCQEIEMFYPAENKSEEYTSHEKLLKSSPLNEIFESGTCFLA